MLGSEGDDADRAAAVRAAVGSEAERGLLLFRLLLVLGGFFAATVGEQQDQAGDAEGESDAEGHVRDQRVALRLVEQILRGRVFELALRLQGEPTEDGADDDAGASEAERDGGGDDRRATA